MKEELLVSVENRIEILESKLFDKENENDQLKEEVQKLRQEIKEKSKENENMEHELRQSEQKTDEFLNNQEQYSRINNIRVSGIPEELFPKIVVKYVKKDTGNKIQKTDEQKETETTSPKQVETEKEK